mgnify:CR=1 FL=1
MLKALVSSVKYYTIPSTVCVNGVSGLGSNGDVQHFARVSSYSLELYFIPYEIIKLLT